MQSGSTGIFRPSRSCAHIHTCNAVNVTNYFDQQYFVCWAWHHNHFTSSFLATARVRQPSTPAYLILCGTEFFSLLWVISCFFISWCLYCVEDNQEEMVNWLLVHQQPQSKLLEFWRLTAKKRLLYIHGGGSPLLGTVLQQWPRYKDKDGFILVCVCSHSVNWLLGARHAQCECSWRLTQVQLFAVRRGARRARSECTIEDSDLVNGSYLETYSRLSNGTISLLSPP
jgi:hypothetical protein